MKPITILTAMALAAGLTGGARAQTGTPGHSAMPGITQPNDPPSTKDFEAADARMMQNMQVPYSGDPDVDFRTHMIPHHQGAIAMARVALAHAKDAGTKTMAQKIIDDQEKEIAEMQAWLKQHGK